MSRTNFRRSSTSYSRQRPYGGNRRQRTTSNSSRGPKKDYIDPAKFVSQAKTAKVERYNPTNSFSDFNITPALKTRIVERGFKEPSPIQDQIIPHGLNGKDVIGIANTGTGKTMAFAIPIMHHLAERPGSKALIMAPTRELAAQILDECKTLLTNSGLSWTLLIGGAPMRRQLSDLSRRPALVIGTPGRIKDHIERGSLRLDGFDMVVLDEVDRMLDMGFVHDMRHILSLIPTSNRQSYFFSATVDHRVRTIISEFSQDPIMISVKTADTSELVDQSVIKYMHDEDKISRLHEALTGSEKKILLFDDTRRQVERLSKSLQADGFSADAIHGGRSQSQRKRSLDKFKQNQTSILVATDVAARGIDVDGITHVINYSTPQTYDDYVHRIGRAGRAGKTGYAITFVKT